jgi:hypothetical protein
MESGQIINDEVCIVLYSCYVSYDFYDSVRNDRNVFYCYP